MIFRKLIPSIIFVFVVLPILKVNAQQGFGTSTPNKNAVLDLTSTNKGLLLPRVTLVSTISFAPLDAHVAGMIIYNTATTTTGLNDVTPGYYFNDGAKWVRAINSVSAAGWSLTGNSSTTPGTNFLGTTDTQDIVFKTNSIENFRINQKGRLIGNSTFPAIGANSLYIGAAGNDTQLAGAVKNTAIGYQTMNALTDGSENTAVGNLSLNLLKDGIYNTGFGVQSLSKAVSTIGNTGLGYQSLFNATGDFNTAIGSESGRNLTSGENNTAIGQATNFASATASNQLNIANNLFGTGLNGTVAVPKGKIGIGTASPDNTLHVKATADPLKLEGLKTGAVGDKMLTVGTDGVVKQQAYPGLLVSNFISASYTIIATDYLIIITQPAPAAPITITFPNPALNYGRVINISNFADGATSPVTLKSFVGTQLKTGTIGATATAILEPADGTVASGKGKSTWISNGALWYIIGN